MRRGNAAGKARGRRSSVTEPLSLTNLFLLQWRALGGPELESEVRFAPPRRWRFDFIHAPSRAAVELEGGIAQGGRHVRPLGFARDAEKYNAAQTMGYRVFRLSRVNLTNDPVGTLTPIIEFMRGGQQ
ncbi:MAG: hypothetical protein KGL39_36795 [Patescibacteria group bacterium]|nr:hypothetical protein [Patescibacteria group bacterium]